MRIRLAVTLDITRDREPGQPTDDRGGPGAQVETAPEYKGQRLGFTLPDQDDDRAGSVR